jgi:uncharacterized membrane-anchored protein YjiN (DUF445 family)
VTSTDAPPADTDFGLQFSPADAGRLRGLRRMRALALSLLVLAAIIYVLTLDRDGAWAYVNAASEAAMVGAIADWFAVTALFRHPLGLPIPHTAIIPNRKAALGASLEEFVAENFLRPEVIRERIDSAQVSRRAGEWLVADGHARRIVEEGSRTLADALSAVQERDVAAIIEQALIPRLVDEPLSPVVGQLLEEVLRDGAHVGLVDLVLDELGRWLAVHEDEVSALIENRAPSWTPEWVDKRVSGWVHRQTVDWVGEISRVPDHPARQSLDRWLADMAHELQHDPDTKARFEALKQRMLAQPRVVDTSISLWDALRRAVIGSLGDETGLLRRRVLEELEAFGHRLIDDDALTARIDARISDVAAYVIENYGTEIATVISVTVNRWDGKETAERIELHVGRDLQFIRINGTVVGGLAGLTIHAVSALF